MKASNLIEGRLLGAVLAFELAKGMFTTGLWMLQPSTMTSKVAQLSSSYEIFAYIWMALALFVLPYLVIQVSGKFDEYKRKATRLACWAILTSGVFWVYLAFLSRSLDFRYITEILLLHSTTCVVTAALLAYTLNTQYQLRKERNK